METLTMPGKLVSIDFDAKNEWIVEQLIPDKKTRVIGKILFKNPVMQKTIHLNNENLEDIWDLCNYGPSQLQQNRIVSKINTKTNPYENMDCYLSNNESIIYIPMSSVDCVNADIFIRKHYEPTIGYWLKSNFNANEDIWVYGDKKDFINHNVLNNPFYNR